LLVKSHLERRYFFSELLLCLHLTIGVKKKSIKESDGQQQQKKLYVNVEYCAKVLHTIFVRQNTKLVIILIKKKEVFKK